MRRTENPSCAPGCRTVCCAPVNRSISFFFRSAAGTRLRGTDEQVADAGHGGAVIAGQARAAVGAFESPHRLARQQVALQHALFHQLQRFGGTRLRGPHRSCRTAAGRAILSAWGRPPRRRNRAARARPCGLPARSVAASPPRPPPLTGGASAPGSAPAPPRKSAAPASPSNSTGPL